MKTLHLFLLLLFISFATQAQVGKFIKEGADKGKKTKDKIKDKANQDPNELLKDGADLAWDGIQAKIEEARQDYDTATFNYAIALSDNAGFFEEQEKFGKYKDLIFMVIDKADLQQDNDPLRKARDHNNIGEMSLAGNKFKIAEKSFLKSKNILEENSLSNDPFYLGTKSNLALLYHALGRYAEAEKLTLETLQKREELLGQDNSSYGASLNNLAMIYKDQGKYGQAEKLVNEALSVTEATEGTQSTAYAIILNNKAILLQNVGRYQEAEGLLKQSLGIAESSLREKSTNYQRLLVNLALLYQEMERYDEAEEIYLEAIRRKEVQWKKNHPDYAHMLNNLASLYMLMERYDEVEGLLLESEKIYSKKFGENHPAYATTVNNLGIFYRTQGDFKKAEKYLKQALDIRKDVLGENHPQFVQSQEALAIAYWQGGSSSQAQSLYLEVLNKSNEFIKSYFPSMSEAEKEKYWGQLRPTFLRFYAFAVENPNREVLKMMYENHILTKAILLSSSNKVKQRILNSGETDLIEKYENWIDLKEQLAKYYSFSKTELEEANIDLYSLEQEANSLEKQLSESSELFSQGYDMPVLTFDDIKNSLGGNEAIVDIIQFPKFAGKMLNENYYAALVITSDAQEPNLVLIENGTELDTKYFKYYRNMIQSKKEDKYSYEQFWSKIDVALEGKSQIYLSLDGVYNQISISTLRKPDGSYLVEDKTFVLLTNSKDLYALKNELRLSNGPLVATLLGFPNYGSGGQIPALPGTKTEVESISQILRNSGFQLNVFLANEASESNLKSIVHPVILHVATHGFFVADVNENAKKQVFGINPTQAKNNPLLRSGLMLANAEQVFQENNYDIDNNDNGILTAYEASLMDLEGTEMVILSACETGLGDVKAGEGVYGLQRSFQVAGAESIVMSLWKVSDDATQKLMTAFYKYYLELNDKVAAFKKAQLELKAEYPQPYFWGAFVMIGG